MTATAPDKPLPIIDPGSRPFWDAAREHRLSIPRCRSCENHFFYPRELCPFCHSGDLEWVDASGRGTVYSFTIVRKPAGPAFAADVPYVVAMIALDEGPRMLTNLIVDDVEAVRIGDRVEVSFVDVTDDVTLPKFKLVEGSG